MSTTALQIAILQSWKLSQRQCNCVVVSLIGLYMALTMSSSYCLAADPILETLIKGIEYQESLLREGVGTLSVKITYNKTEGVYLEGTFDEERHIFYAFKGEKKRCDFKSTWRTKEGIPYAVSYHQAYDGEKMMQWRMDDFIPRKRKEVKKKGSIRSEDIISYINDPATYGWRYFRKSLLEIIRQNQVRLLGTQSINGDPCHVVEVLFTKGTRAKIWVNEAKGFRPQKIEVYAGDGEILGAIDSVVYKKYNGEIWFPQSGIYKCYDIDPLAGKSVVALQCKMTIKEYKINVGVKDELFIIDFPKGTHVFDAQLRIGYIVGIPKVVERDSLRSDELRINGRISALEYQDRTVKHLSSFVQSLRSKNPDNQNRNKLLAWILIPCSLVFCIVMSILLLCIRHATRSRN